MPENPGSYRPGSDCFKQVVAAFGEQVVGDDGQINRPVSLPRVLCGSCY